jgi:transcriptional regulator with XRE-family HTH domain
MAQTSAQRIGTYIRKHREARGLSQNKLAALSGVNQSTVIRIERGDFRQPNPETLQALVSALEVPLADVWSLAGYQVDGKLPSTLPFLRAKYRDLSDKEMDSLTNDVAYLLRQYGINPEDGPLPGEDEQSDPMPDSIPLRRRTTNHKKKGGSTP